ncbi:peptidoglycan editing factor PgeF [Colwellia sp. Bg11-28]|jgi:YfiH family protein|uniref:peptidoglycan editing factor PgeF n=1 Tax=Colwellia sp. Bg11-28 TaxID=2058305 RepID=UPI000C32E716|nr:peptidoglycan editing factor PgeF [Colwellia sp. Bg11-28]PKH85082.1 peptidoglycan editing factor PgeF [Colwellia sp. Bg11-28]
MLKTNTSHSKRAHFTNATVELVKWPFNSSYSLDDKVLALQTTRLSPQLSLNSSLTPSLNEQVSSAFGDFNLGMHVGDNAERVTYNRNVLNRFISQQLFNKTVKSNTQLIDEVKIQWLEQVHGNEVVTITSVDEQARVADASITSQKNIVLAIMTADCLPILLSHKTGSEVAAIHGGWRPLVANIIAKTIAKMNSQPSDIVAWLGPCIGQNAFEVGSEVKLAFTQLDIAFANAFVKQANGKYLADLHQIARLQLVSLGVTVITSLAECTYQETEKYYSYRRKQITGRMASLICRR